MMGKIKLVWECDNCHKKFKNLQFVEGKQLCYFCRKGLSNNIWTPVKFNDFLTKKFTFWVSLTEEQEKSLLKRIKDLKISKSEYARKLVLIDIENYMRLK